MEGCADGSLPIALAYRECSVAEALDAGYHEFLKARNFCATGGSAERSSIFGTPGPAAAHGRAKRLLPSGGAQIESKRAATEISFPRPGRTPWTSSSNVSPLFRAAANIEGQTWATGATRETKAGGTRWNVACDKS